MEIPNTDSKNFFERHPKKTITIVILLTCSLLLIGAEGILRWTGKKTLIQQFGNKKKPFCRRTEKAAKLEVTLTHCFDADGIFKLRTSDTNTRTDGFTGNEFIYANTTSHKILMLGDSFLWGSSAKPRSNCFAELVQEEGYHVYNSGMPCVDPLQYRRVAQKYIPILKPNITAVFLFCGNDLRPFPEPEPEKPTHYLYYSTNFGFLRGYDDFRCYFDSPQEAFDYYSKSRCGRTNGLYDAFIFRTVLGRKFYKIVRHSGKKKKVQYPKNKWVTNALAKIRTTAEKNNSKFFLFLIPYVSKWNNKKYVFIDKKILNFLKDFHCYYPKDLTGDDYRPAPDGHFNNEGHKKYANYIIKVLKDNGFTP